MITPNNKHIAHKIFLMYQHQTLYAVNGINACILTPCCHEVSQLEQIKTTHIHGGPVSKVRGMV